MFKSLFVGPNRPPSIIKVDEKPAIRFVDAAIEQRLEHMATKNFAGLLGSHLRAFRSVSLRSVLAPPQRES